MERALPQAAGPFFALRSILSRTEAVRRAAALSKGFGRC